jgi:hypothetical protein
MNAQTIRVLYIGEDQSTLLDVISSAIPRDQVMVASNSKTALAMYALYMPDVIVVDGQSDAAQGALPHLGVFGTSDTLDLMLVLSDGELQHIPENAILYQLPSTSSRNEILYALDRLAAECDSIGSLLNLPHSA